MPRWPQNIHSSFEGAILHWRLCPMTIWIKAADTTTFYVLQLQMIVGTTFDLIINKKWKEAISHTWGGLGVFRAQVTETIHTHVYRSHTSCGSEILIHWSSFMCSKFNTTSHTTSSVTRSKVIFFKCGRVSSPMYRGENRGEQTRAPPATNCNAWQHTARVKANSYYSQLMGHWTRKGSTEQAQQKRNCGRHEQKCVGDGGGEKVYNTVWLPITDHAGQTYVCRWLAVVAKYHKDEGQR